MGSRALHTLSCIGVLGNRKRAIAGDIGKQEGPPVAPLLGGVSGTRPFLCDDSEAPKGA